MNRSRENKKKLHQDEEETGLATYSVWAAWILQEVPVIGKNTNVLVPRSSQVFSQTRMILTMHDLHHSHGVTLTLNRRLVRENDSVSIMWCRSYNWCIIRIKEELLASLTKYKACKHKQGHWNRSPLCFSSTFCTCRTIREQYAKILQPCSQCSPV